MGKPDIPVTPAVRALRAARAVFRPHLYGYVDRGGTAHTALSLGVDHQAVVKTLVMEAHDDGRRREPLLVVMHGDLEVSTKQLARYLGVKAALPATKASVAKYTGYLPGGVSPFGARTTLPVYATETIFALDRVYINGGKRGFLVAIHPAMLTSLLAAVAVRGGIYESRG